VFHVAEPAEQCAAADRMEGREQIGGSLGPIGQIAHHQHGPLIADQLQRSRDRTTITCTSSHGFFEFRVSSFEFRVSSFDKLILYVLIFEFSVVGFMPSNLAARD
jgi:hypothetical protein